jgi:integrase
VHALVIPIHLRKQRRPFVQPFGHDVHALRHIFGTLLSNGNVAPRTAQAAMRHSSLDLTMDVYTDPQLLDVAGAQSALQQSA